MKSNHQRCCWNLPQAPEGPAGRWLLTYRSRRLEEPDTWAHLSGGEMRRISVGKQTSSSEEQELFGKKRNMCDFKVKWPFNATVLNRVFLHVEKTNSDQAGVVTPLSFWIPFKAVLAARLTDVLRSDKDLFVAGSPETALRKSRATEQQAAEAVAAAGGQISNCWQPAETFLRKDDDQCSLLRRWPAVLYPQLLLNYQGRFSRVVSCLLALSPDVWCLYRCCLQGAKNRTELIQSEESNASFSF